MNREQMLARMQAILDAAEAREETARTLTTEEQAEFDGLKSKVDALDAAETARVTAAAELATRRQEVLARRTAPTPAVPPAPAPSSRSVPLRGPEVKEFSTLAEFCEAAVWNPNDQRLEWRDSNRQERMRSEQRMDSGQTGGFLIPKQFLAEILRVSGPAAIVRPRARVIPAGSPPDAEIEIPALDQTGDSPNNVYGGVVVNWIAEGGAKPETDADFRNVTLKPKEVAGHIVMTDKFMRNSAAGAAFIASMLPEALASAEDFAFISGNGIGRPQGFIGSDAQYVVGRDTNDSVTYNDTVQMLSRIKGNGVWIANRALLPILSQIQDNSGGTGVGAYIFAQGNMQGGIPDSMWGHPIVWSERSPALGARGDLAFVDLSYYLIKDGSGPFIAYSEHVHFLNNKTVVKAFTNVDGNCWLTAPFTGQDGRKTSPFVVLGANGEAETA